MESLLLPLEVVLGVLLLLALGVAFVTLRRRVLTRRLGAFDCSARRPGEGWAFGLAGYGRDELHWYRTFGVAPRARWSWDRYDLSVRSRRRPEGGEAFAVLPDAVVVVCEHRGEVLELAMTEDAYTGFASWLESAPPGRNVNVA